MITTLLLLQGEEKITTKHYWQVLIEDPYLNTLLFSFSARESGEEIDEEAVRSEMMKRFEEGKQVQSVFALTAFFY